MEGLEKKIQILLVDDDEDEYLLTQDLLYRRVDPIHGTGRQRFHLDWVSTYELGLAAIRRREHDIYLVDYNLGQGDGLQLLREAIASGCQEPIIILTGQGNYEVDIAAMQSGAADYLVKGKIDAPLLERSIRYALERNRLEQQLQESAERAEILASLSHSFAEAGLDYNTLVDTITRRISESSGDAVLIRVLSENGTLEPIAVHHPDPLRLREMRQAITLAPIRPGDGPVGESFVKGVPYLATDLSPAAREMQGLDSYWPWLERFPMSSIAIVPLRSRGRTVGTLSLLRSAGSSAHTRDELSYYQDLANRAALALDNARLYAEETRRALELNALQRATLALLGSLNLEVLIEQILDAAQSAIPAAEKGTLHLVAPDTGQLQIRATLGDSGNPRIQKFLLRRQNDYVGAAVRERRTLLIRDIQEDMAQQGTKTEGQEWAGIRSVIVVPLIWQEEALGALSLSASAPGAFREADLHLLSSFAAAATAAIQNAMLHSQVQRLAITDSLTNHYNRRGFLELGRREIRRFQRFRHPLAAVMMDLDNFKVINDAYGHSIGDQVLRAVANICSAHIRQIDILGRYGGDEFAILLPEADPAMAIEVAERIRKSVTGEPILTSAGPVQATLSMGIAIASPEIRDLEGLIDQADKALYAAKQKGRNCVELYSS